MPHQRRIEGLIAEMTLEEKIGQLGAFADALRPFAFEVNPETFARDAEQVHQQIRAGRVGALFNGVGAAEGRNASAKAPSWPIFSSSVISAISPSILR